MEASGHLGELGIVGISGGARYACASAASLGSRVNHVPLVASTAPQRIAELFNDLPAEDHAVPDRPGVREILTATTIEAFRQGSCATCQHPIRS